MKEKQNTFHPQTAKMIATVAQNLPEMSAEIMQGWIGNPTALKKALREALLPSAETGKIKVLQILNYIADVSVLTTQKFFFAHEHFSTKSAEVKFYGFGSNFENWFLKKVEDPIEETSIKCYELLKDSLDDPIINELGGGERSETTLTELYSLLKDQGQGKKGALLTNGYANIFYVRDATNTLRAVSVRWLVVGWGVLAYSVSDPPWWDAGSQVFSRNS